MWFSEVVQFAWFLPTTVGVDVARLFAALIGDEADFVQKNKAPTQGNPMLGVAGGNGSFFQAQVHLQPGRVDLYLRPFEEQDLSKFPLLDTEAALNSVVDSIEKNEAVFPDALRMAVLCSMVEPCTNYEEAFVLASGLAGVKVINSDFHDFSFQINRRRNVVPDVEFNRVLRWQAVSFRNVQLAVQNTHYGQAFQQSTQVLTEQFAASFAVDVNTVPSGRIFKSVEQVPIFKALVDENIRLGKSRKISSLEEV